jgi:hypothetical protein
VAGRARSFPLGEVLKELVKQRGTVLDPQSIVRVYQGQAGEHGGQASGLGSPKFLVFQVEVVNELCDGAQAGHLEREASAEHLEGALVPLVGVFGRKHVEAQLSSLGDVTFRGHELEARFAIDEASDQPRAGDAIDVNVSSRDPRPALQLARQAIGFIGGRYRGRVQLRPKPRDDPLRRLSARSSEEVDGADLFEPPLEAPEIALQLSSSVTVPVDAVGDLARVRRQRAIVSITRGAKQVLDVGVAETIDETRLEQGRFTAGPCHLTEDPLEVLLRRVGARQNVDRVLERDRTDARQPTADLDAQVVGFRWDLMDEEKPPPRAVEI